MVELKETIDLYISAVDKVEFCWNFYSIVVISLIGWLLTHRQAMPRHFKALLTAVFLFFAMLNLNSLMGAYELSDALQEDLLLQLETVKDHGLNSTHLVFHEMGYEHQKIAAYVIHLIIGAMMLFMIWHRRFGLRVDENVNTEQNTHS